MVPNGVCLSAFAPKVLKAPQSYWTTADRLQILKDNLDIQKEEKIILTVSRLVEKNGIEDLIKAFRLLIFNFQSPIFNKMSNVKCQMSNVKLLIIGDGPLKNKLQRLVQKLNIGDKVIFAGSVKYEDLPAYYGIADVFCRPSHSEGLGNVFLEAMAAGVPVIATPVGGTPDFLKDKETGWFCEPKKPQSIAEKIEYVLDEKNRTEVEQVVTNARKMVEEGYGWGIIAEKMRHVFQSLLV